MVRRFQFDRRGLRVVSTLLNLLLAYFRYDGDPRTLPGLRIIRWIGSSFGVHLGQVVLNSSVASQLALAPS